MRLIVEYADRHHMYLHDVVEHATIGDLTYMAALGIVKSEAEEQRASMARTRSAAHAAR